MKKIIVIVLLFFVIQTEFSPVLAAENWSMYNHDPTLGGRTGEYTTGTVTKKWEREFPTAAHLRAQPLVVDNIIYQTFMDGTFRAIAMDTGVDLWNIQTGGVIMGSAVVGSNRAVIAISKGNSGEVQGFDLQGNLKWTVTASEPFIASPIMYRGIVYIGGLDENLYAIDAEDGIVLWSKQVMGGIQGPVAIKNTTIVLETNELKGYAFSLSGEQLWTINLPGESVRENHPMIGKNTVIFTMSSRGHEAEGPEGAPYWSDHMLDVRWDGSPPTFATPQDLLAANLEFYNSHPESTPQVAVDLTTGQKKFDIPLSTPYWGQVPPLMLTDQLAFKQSSVRYWTIDMDTGQITMLGTAGLLFRSDEYAYGSMGGNKHFYGAIADDLGVTDINQLSTTTLIGDFSTHATTEWIHPVNTTNQYTATAGSGDGNSGYATTPVIYNGKIVVESNASWLGVYQGTAVREQTDTQAPSIPTNLQAISNGNVVKLTWNQATDNIGTTSYGVYRNGVLIAETDETSYNDINLLPNTTYQYSVNASDIQRNQSGQSQIYQITTGTSLTISPTPSNLGNGDANADGVINIQDVKTVLQNWLATFTSSLDQYKDGQINAVDAVRVIKMLP